jgi:hypothetical protein
MDRVPAHIPDYLESVLSIEPVLDIWSEEPVYRAEITLLGGQRLPCVVFRSALRRVRHAVHAFENSQRSSTSVGDSYLAMVRVFVCSGHQIAATAVRDVAPSRYAIPPRIRDDLYAMAQMRGTDLNAQMLWFRGEMDDGARFDFGFSEGGEFLQMPDGYRASQLIRVDPLKKKPKVPFGGMDSFACYLDGLG